MSRFKQVIKKKELESALSKHPLREIDEQVKSDYVKGLVFVATEDGNFHEEEKSYVVSLMKNIGLEETLLEEFEAFSSGCEEEELLAFMDRLKGFQEDIKLNFLIEVVVIAFRDGEFDEKEQGMFDDYLEMLGLANQKDDIMYMALALVNKDVDLALSLYTAKKEFFNKFDYMFDMLDIDIEKELHSVYSWEWTVWETLNNDKLDVSLKPESTRRFCIFLNSQIIKGEFKQRVGTNKFIYDDVVILDDGDFSNLTFENGLYSYQIDENILFINININKNIFKLYPQWLKEQRDVSVNLINRNSSIIDFKTDCAGQPYEGSYEAFLGIMATQASMFFLSNYDKSKILNFYTNRNFKSQMQQLKMQKEEFTFRLMKVEE